MTNPQSLPAYDLAFVVNDLDTLSETRTEDSVAQALAHEGASILLIGGGNIALRAANTEDPGFTTDELTAFGIAMEETILLGNAASGPVLACHLDLEKLEGRDGIRIATLREIFLDKLMPPAWLGPVAQGAALLAWHENHAFCGRCGGTSAMRSGGYKRVCQSCSTEHFPRTDPVVIMLTLSGERCLLGRSPRFAPGVYSCLAGFLEPGETIEGAVRRETREESGVLLGEVSYQSSQPWPFPYSLMIGCTAIALSETISFDSDELEDCRWFSREEVREMVTKTHPQDLLLPNPGSIAYNLVLDWAYQD